MTDSVSAARSARENLAQGLAALQSPGVPQQLGDVAEPVAEAMSALHRIEATQGSAIGEAGPVALAAVRRALSMLQAQPAGHPAVDQAVEAVAGSLGLVHSLTQAPAPAPAAPQAAAASPFAGTVMMNDPGAMPPTQPSAQAFPAQAPAPQPYVQPGPPAQPPAQAQPPYQPPPQQAYQPPPQPPEPPQPQQPAYEPPQQQAFPPPAPQPGFSPPNAQQPYGQPPNQWQQPAAAAPWAQQAAPAAAPAQAPQAPPQDAAPPSNGSTLRVEAALGVHSTTNFYKGLSGNDIIECGGIFVATYQIPPVGQDVVLKVSLPGGYEFEARGVVRWTRDAPNSGSDVSPGFGAQFTQISPEGRQLVYRYVRKREPLFHDDL